MDLSIRQRFSEIQNSINWPVYLFDYEGTCIDSNNPDKIGEKVEVPDIEYGELLRTGKFQWISVSSGMGMDIYYIAMLGTDASATGAMQLIRLVFKESEEVSDAASILRHLLFNYEEAAYTRQDLSDAGVELTPPLQVVLVEHKGAGPDEVSVIVGNILENTYTVEIDKHHLAVITSESESLREDLRTVMSELNTELLIPANFGIGKTVESPLEIGHSYRGAKSALMLGKRLGQEKHIFDYRQMMIYHLVSEVDQTVRKRYFSDYGEAFEQLVDDEELIQTAIRFFENDLNITETSRQLYVHRNTLIYRLNKIEKLTGLDLRSFDDSIQFYMLMLIWRLFGQQM